MGKPNDRRREKHDKKRAQAKQRAKERELPTSIGGLVRLAATKPFGPSWVSASYDTADPTSVPTLITVIVTRKLPGGLLLPGLAMVDRACLGIKDGFAMEPASEHDAACRIADLAERGDDPMRPCELLLAQSIVFHAIDYASSLGFRPHLDFPAALFEPRPPALLPTSGARPDRPCYWSGPRDDVRRIVRQLDAAVGRGNYEFVGHVDNDLDDEEFWPSDEDDDFDDEELADEELHDHADDAQRRMLVAARGEPFMPVRLYYAAPSPDDTIRRLEALHCIAHDPASRSWRWLLQAEAADLRIGEHALSSTLSAASSVLAEIRFPTHGTMTLQTSSGEHAVAAARFFAPRLGADATLCRARVVNRCFDAGEGRPEELARMLDRDVTVIDPEIAARRLEHDLAGIRPGSWEDAEQAADAALRRRIAAGDDVPLVEDFPLHPEEESPDFSDLRFTLRLRALRAAEHWRGATDVTLTSLILRMAGQAGLDRRLA